MPYKNKVTTPRFNGRTIALSAIALLVIASALLYITNRDASNSLAGSKNSTEAGTYSNEPGTQKLNLNPPTENEKKQAEDNKEALAKQMEATTPPAGTTKRSVKPQLNNPGQYGDVIEVRALVPSIQEAGGTCTATFTQNTATFSKTSPGISDATTTRCTPISVPRGEFPAAGNWTVAVTYSSDTSQGTSDPETFPVQ